METKVYGLLRGLTKHHLTPKGWKMILMVGLPGGVGSLGMLMKQSESSATPVTVQAAAVFAFLWFSN